MQFKAMKPSHCTFSGFGAMLKNFVSFNSFVVTNDNFSTVHKGYTSTFPETDSIEKKHHWAKNFVFYFHKTIV
jgi:hypothetical protein